MRVLLKTNTVAAHIRKVIILFFRNRNPDRLSQIY